MLRQNLLQRGDYAQWVTLRKVGTTLREFPRSSTKFLMRRADFRVFGARMGVGRSFGAENDRFGAKQDAKRLIGAKKPGNGAGGGSRGKNDGDGT